MNNAEYEEDWGLKKKSSSNKSAVPANNGKTSVDDNYAADWGLNNKSESDKGSALKNLMMSIMSGDLFDPENKLHRNLGQMAIRGSQFIPQDAGNAALGAGKDLIEGVPSLLNQLISNPVRGAKNVGAGAVGIPANIVNAVLSAPSYLARLESDKLSGKIKGITPQIPKEKIQNFIGGEPDQEDINVRRLTELLPVAIPAGRGLAKNAVPIAKGAANAAATVGNTLTFGKIPGKSDPAIAASKIQAESQLNEVMQQLDKAKEEHLSNIEKHKQAIEDAKNKINMSDSARMGYKINAHNEKLNDLKNQTEQLSQQLQEFPLPPASPKVDTNHIDNLNKSLNQLSEHEQNVNEARQHHDESKDLANEAESGLSDYVESGALHDVRAARLLKDDLTKAYDKGSDKYEKVKSDVADQGIILPVTKDAKQINNELSKLITEEKDTTLSSPKAKELLSELDNLNSQDVIKASDYMSAIKSVNGYMRDAYNKAFQPGINEDVRVHWKNQGDQAKEQLQKMNSILEKNIGKENFSNLKDANDYWKKNIIPLYKEPTYWKIMQKEKMSENMASELRGGAPGSGIDIIRNTAKNNPQVVKHIVGQRYDANAKSIHNPNELMNEYIQQDPILQKIISSRNEAHNSISEAKQHLSSAEEKYAQAQDAHSKALKASNIKEKEITNLTKAYNKKTQEHVEQKAELEKKINKFQSEIKQIQSKIPVIEKHMKDVKEQANQEKISLNTKIQLEKKRDQLKQEHKLLQEKLSDSTTGLKKAWMIMKTVYRIGRKIT